MLIISKIARQDKRPTNALIANAVELFEARTRSYLTNGNYTYGNNAYSSLVAFKHRNGFEQVNFPRVLHSADLDGRTSRPAAAVQKLRRVGSRVHSLHGLAL
jgi:hypothetical protein